MEKIEILIIKYSIISPGLPSIKIRWCSHHFLMIFIHMRYEISGGLLTGKHYNQDLLQALGGTMFNTENQDV